MKVQNIISMTTKLSKLAAMFTSGKHVLIFLMLFSLLNISATGQTAKLSDEGVRRKEAAHLPASWDFDDEKLTSREGHEAIQTQNLWLTPSWSGNAIAIDSREAAFLRYPAFDENDRPLITPPMAQ